MRIHRIIAYLFIMSCMLMLIPAQGLAWQSKQENSSSNHLININDNEEPMSLPGPVSSDFEKSDTDEIPIALEEKTFNMQADSFYESIEWEIFQMVNYERINRGLSALQMDDSLRNIARSHSQDMGDNGFFSHESPDNGNFIQRINSWGIPYVWAGENIHRFPSGSAEIAMYGGVITSGT